MICKTLVKLADAIDKEGLSFNPESQDIAIHTDLLRPEEKDNLMNDISISCFKFSYNSLTLQFEGIQL